MITLTEFTTQLDALFDSTEQAAEHYISLYGAATAEKKRWTQAAETVKERFTEIIVETGNTAWKTRAGTAKVIAPSVRAEYDTTALDELCAEDEYVAQLVLPLRKEKQVAGFLRIDPHARK